MSGESIEHEDEISHAAGPKETRGPLSGDRTWSLHVNPSYRYNEVITPGTGLLTGGACDAIILAADGTVTQTPAEDPAATPTVLTLKGGVAWPISCAKITATSTTVTALWHRKPPT